MFDLKGKHAIVTGASGGIGSAIAREFHSAGATVVLSGTRESILNTLADELSNRCYVISCNLNDPQGPNSLVDKALEQMGSVDILVNNAGMTRDALVLRMKDDDWQAVINVNLTSTFQLSRACLRGMLKQRWGRIINISSIVGATGNTGQANYAASKAGMEGLSKSLAQEVASRGITVNCIAPGFIMTAMTDGLSNEMKMELIKAIPKGRFGEVRDVAAGAVYLASEESEYMTGQTLHINGGMAMI